MTAGTHGSTFGGNPLAMAVGNAVLDIVLEPSFLDHVNKIANYLKQQLAMVADKHRDVVEEVRGRGLAARPQMQGRRTTRLIDALRERGLLTVGAGDNVVRILPPLIIDESACRARRSAS